MTVRINKPALNLREKLTELDKPSGIAGEAMLRAETPQEQFNLIGAGRKNLIINGGFDVWQRGTNFTGHGQYYADRWQEFANTNDGYTVQKVDLNTFDIDATGQTHALAITTTAGGSGNLNDLRQKVEFPERFYNKTLTLSFWYKSDSTATINSIRVGSYINSVFTVHLDNQTVNATTSWQKAEYTFTVSGTNISTLTANDFLDVIVSSPVNQTTNYYLTGVQLELGSVATPFEHRSYGEELALCQRYGLRLGEGGKRVAMGSAGSATTGLLLVQPLTPFRVIPSLVINNIGQIVREGVAWYPLTGLTLNAESSVNALALNYSIAGSGLGAGQVCVAGKGMDIFLDAEL